MAENCPNHCPTKQTFQKRKRTFPGATDVPNIPRERDEEEELENGVLLRRFAHQVAGRSPMYCFDNNETVCKPLNMREAEFYNSRGFPKRLERFTPRYHGSTVAVCHGSDVIAIDQAVTGQSSASLSGRNRNPPESESGSSCSDEDDEELNSEEEAMHEELSPWSAKIHQKETLQQKIGKDCILLVSGRRIPDSGQIREIRQVTPTLFLPGRTYIKILEEKRFGAKSVQ